MTKTTPAYRRQVTSAYLLAELNLGLLGRLPRILIVLSFESFRGMQHQLLQCVYMTYWYSDGLVPGGRVSKLCALLSVLLCA